MSRIFLQLLAGGLLALTFVEAIYAQGGNRNVAQWDFDVYLDNRKLGEHVFTISESGGVKQVRSEASFKYSFLFIPAYRYKHSAAERWTNDCLLELDASTNINGKEIQVSGTQTGAGFVVKGDDNPVELPECVMTFAYWNPEFLDQPRLLNPQTGEYVDVRIEKVGDEMLEVRGQPVAARRFKLTANDVDLTLWYSPDDEWLALESVAKGGRIIRYELS